MQKPTSIIRQEFINNLSDLINQSNLPIFVIKPIFADLLNQLSALEKQELEIDTKKWSDYEKSLNTQTEHTGSLSV